MNVSILPRCWSYLEQPNYLLVKTPTNRWDVEQMLEAKKQLQLATSESQKNYYEDKCNALDRQIDPLVYELYGLTEEEIKIVEGK